MPFSQLRRRILADHDYRQNTATLENCSQLTWTLRIEMLREDDWRGKSLVQSTDERRKSSHATCRRANYYEIVNAEF